VANLLEHFVQNSRTGLTAAGTAPVFNRIPFLIPFEETYLLANLCNIYKKTARRSISLTNRRI